MIRYINYIFIVVIVLCLYSCKPKCFGIEVDMGLVLKIQDEHGNNLLNSRYFSDSIKLYHIFSDGCTVYYYNNASDVPNGFIIYNDVIVIDLIPLRIHEHGDNLYRFSPSTVDSCRMFIEWNSQDTDTIFTTFAHIKSTKKNPLPSGYCSWHLYDKVYYNGKLIVSSWEDNQEKMSQGIYPVIIK